MKKPFLLAIIVSIFALQHVNAQPTINPPPSPPRANFNDRVRQLMNAQSDTNTYQLTRFNLNFPGGKPQELADFIEKAMGKPLNVIIPPEFADTQIPPIRVNDVSVPQLFETLQLGSRKYAVSGGGVQSSYGFNTIDGPRSDNTIWTFSVFTNQAPSPLTKFSIDFPGGTPKELVAAIERATGHPLNVVVPDEYADTKLPPLKMNEVDVSELFDALEHASAKTEPYVSGTMFGGYQNYQQMQTGFGFKTDGRPTDDSIWYFYVNKVPAHANLPSKVSRFYALAPFIDHGLTVDDITTAVETAWKMAGEKSPPEISFHKDTKLLIAVGDPEKLKTIDAVLEALKPERPNKPPPAPAPPEKKSGEDKPTE